MNQVAAIWCPFILNVNYNSRSDSEIYLFLVKNNFVKQLYTDLKVPYPDEAGPWIGLRETPTPEWSDKSSVAFVNWANGQPDDYVNYSFSLF